MEETNTPAAAPASAGQPKARPDASPGPVPAPGALPKISIAAVVVSNAAVQFSDRSISPPVNLGIQEAGGTITGLSSEAVGHAELALHARVDNVGPVEVTGLINLLSLSKSPGPTSAGAAQTNDIRTTLFPRRVELAAPLTDIPNTYAEWQLFVPVSQRLSSFDGSMTVARYGLTATLLADGRVLAVGGTDGDITPSIAELFDPATARFTETGSMTTGRFAFTATLLANGEVLVAGGNSDGAGLASVEHYDPAVGTFSATGSMTVPRWSHSATLLGNGTVLIAGGFRNGGALASAEVYQ